MRNFWSFQFVVLGLSTLLIGACSSGGRTLIRANYCSKNNNYIKIGDANSYAKKVELKPGVPVSEEASDYAYGNSAVYYHDLNRDVKFLIVNTRDLSGKTKTTLSCIGGTGFNSNMENIEAEIPVVSDIKIGDDKKTYVRTRIFKIAFDIKKIGTPEGKWFSSEVGQTEFFEGDPAQFYNEFEEAKQVFTKVKVESTDRKVHQLISHLSTSQANQKTGKNDKVIVRTIVNFKAVTPDERQKRDDADKKARDDAEKEKQKQEEQKNEESL